MELEEFFKYLGLKDFTDQFNKLDKNDPKIKEKIKEIFDNYYASLESKIEGNNISMGVAILDFFFIFNHKIALGLISRKNEKVLRAQLVLERIKGIKPRVIKDDLKLAKDSSIFVNGFSLNAKDLEKQKYGDKILEILNSYLKDKDNVDELQKKDLVEFYEGFSLVDNIIFSNTNVQPSRILFINRLFDEEIDLSDELLSKVYNELITNPKISTFDYSSIIEEDSSLLKRVKGIYKKCNNYIFDCITDPSLGEDAYEELVDLLREIVNLNKDDKEGLNWFFKEMKRRLINNKQLDDYLCEQDFLKEYLDFDINKIFDDDVNKLLNGDYNIDESIIEYLGKYKKFIDNFDKLLDSFVNSNDVNYKRKLLIPLTVALIEKQKEKFNLNFNNVFTTTVLDENTLGYYDNEDNVMYVNPNVLNSEVDPDEILICSFDTVFHETRHACQFRDIKKDDSFDFDNLIMAIDIYNRGGLFSNYYKENYTQISYERDAREVAYVDCMTIFRKYPDMQAKISNVNSQLNLSFSNYMRKENIIGEDNYYGIVGHFLEEVSHALLSIKEAEDNETERDIEYKEYLIKRLKSFPVFNQFFDFDEKELTFKIKSEEYFKRKIEEAQRMSDGLEKDIILYSINAFNYSIKVSEFLKNNEYYYGNGMVSDDYSDEVIKEVEDAIGKGPSR